MVDEGKRVTVTPEEHKLKKIHTHTHTHTHRYSQNQPGLVHDRQTNLLFSA